MALRKILVLAAAVCAMAALSVGGVALAGQSSAKHRLLVAKVGGVGQLRLGAKAKTLHDKGLIGKVGPGCELAPGERAARLSPPLGGTAIFFHPNNRLSSIIITKGARTRRHIRIGSPLAHVLNRYPHATYMTPAQMSPFNVGMVTVPFHGHTVMSFLTSAATNRVIQIDIPLASFCE